MTIKKEKPDKVFVIQKHGICSLSIWGAFSTARKAEAYFKKRYKEEKAKTAEERGFFSDFDGYHDYDISYASIDISDRFVEVKSLDYEALPRD